MHGFESQHSNDPSMKQNNSNFQIPHWLEMTSRLDLKSPLASNWFESLPLYITIYIHNVIPMSEHHGVVGGEIVLKYMQKKEEEKKEKE